MCRYVTHNFESWTDKHPKLLIDTLSLALHSTSQLLIKLTNLLSLSFSACSGLFDTVSVYTDISIDYVPFVIGKLLEKRTYPLQLLSINGCMLLDAL